MQYRVIDERGMVSENRRMRSEVFCWPMNRLNAPTGSGLASLNSYWERELSECNIIEILHSCDINELSL